MCVVGRGRQDSSQDPLNPIMAPTQLNLLVPALKSVFSQIPCQYQSLACALCRLSHGSLCQGRLRATYWRPSLEAASASDSPPHPVEAQALKQFLNFSLGFMCLCYNSPGPLGLPQVFLDVSEITADSLP